MSTAKDEDWDHSYYKMVTEAQELLRLGANPMSPLADTSAKSNRTPMSSGDLQKARDLAAGNLAKKPTVSEKDSGNTKKKIQ
jgi:hypothetical protein